MIDVHVSGLAEPIGTTDTHPFWSEDRQAFVPAGELPVGEELRSLTGGQVRVTAIRPRGPPEAVYNLEVDGEHTYFVADGGILVHNACDTAVEEALRAGRLRITGKSGAGANRPPRHHILPQEHRQWFRDRGVNIDKATIVLECRDSFCDSHDAVESTLDGKTPHCRTASRQAIKRSGNLEDCI